MWYIKFVQTIKSKENNISLKTIVEQPNSVFYWKLSKVWGLILQQQIFHGLSSVRKSAGLKSTIIILFTHFHAVELNRKSKTTVLPSSSKKALKKK